MTLDQVTVENFDETLLRLRDEVLIDPNLYVQDQKDSVAIAEIAVTSKVCGVLCKAADRDLHNVLITGSQRNLFAGILATGVMYGWHLHKRLHEAQTLENMLNLETR